MLDQLDQFFMKNPSELFTRPYEYAIVSLENPYLLTAHLLSAIAEKPFTEEDFDFFSKEETLKILQTLENKNLIKKSADKWIYTGRIAPATAFSLNGYSSDNYKVMHENRLLEIMSQMQAYREAHQDAVLLHQGETYIVKNFDLETRIIDVIKKDVDYYTSPLKRTEAKILEILQKKQLNNIDLFFGKLRITLIFIGYAVKRGGNLIGFGDLDLPPIEFETKGLWFTLDNELADKIWNLHPTKKPSLSEKDLPSTIKTFAGYTLKQEIFAGGLHGTEHAIIGLLPYFVMADRWDFGGLSTIFHPDTQKPTIFIYDAYPGGIGLTEKAFTIFDEILKATLKQVAECNCENGCPACIMSPKCGNLNRPLDKFASVQVLKVSLKIN